MSTTRTDEMTITFPGGQRVDARYGETVIRTDQPPANGGEGSAPAPFDLFLASLGTCAGWYVQRFCAGREIPTEGLAVGMRWERDPESHRLTDVRLELRLPPEFPAKYEKAVVRAAERCSVHRALHDPPAVGIEVRH
jgi:ribosomal protein S12 methylthiotransferase accessory factor